MHNQSVDRGPGQTVAQVNEAVVVPAVEPPTVESA